MRLAPGSFAWLLAHDIRLNWRQLTEMFARWSTPATAAVVVIGLLVLHGLAWGVLELRADLPRLFGPGAMATAAAGAVLWMVAQGLLGATRSLYERGDLDVLFASPLPEWKSVTSRALAITATSLAALVPLVLPIANVGALIDGPVWLATYPVILLMALFGTATGFVIAIGLFSTVGPRRARQISQVLAAVIAGAFVLAVQIGLLLPKDFSDDVIAWFSQSRILFAGDSGYWFDVVQAAAHGELATILGLFVIALGSFCAAVAALSGTFARASQLAAGSADDALSSGRAARPFVSGVGPALRRKEWRLLVRDPNLFAQLGLQIVYTLPLAVLLLRSPHDIPPAIALAPLIVVLSAQIAASLAWITVSGEDAPEMIATAPVGDKQAAVAKLSAIAAPLAVILALPMLALASVSPLGALYAFGFGVCAASSTALLNFWHPMAGNRRGLLRRHSQSKIIAIAEHGIALLWAVAVVAAMVKIKFAILPIVLVLGILFLFKPKTLILRRRNSPKVLAPTTALQHT